MTTSTVRFLMTPEKLYALRRELTWTHYRLVMRVENAAARDYYIREAAEQGWNTRQLERNIASLYYKRLLKAPAEGTNLLALNGSPADEPESWPDKNIVQASLAQYSLVS